MWKTRDYNYFHVNARSHIMFYLIVLVLIIVIIYYYTTRNHDYWAKRNVKHVPPIPFFGNQFANIAGIKNDVQIATELYNKHPDEKVVGYYKGITPELIVRDLDIVRDILSVDFNYFYKRGLGRDPKREPLLLNVFHGEGDAWKLLRQRLTPAFTTAKLKNMFPLIIQCAEKLGDVCEAIVAHGGDCDVRDLMARFTTDFIGACGFGIEMNTLYNKNSLFRQLGKKMFSGSIRKNLISLLWTLFPELRSFITVDDPDVEKIVKQLVQNVREQRNYKPSGRNDFIDLLLELEGKGTIEGESIEKLNADNTPASAKMEINLKVISAQVFAFFAAGFETSSSTSSHTLYQLAFNQDIQEKVQEEIDEVLSKYDGKLCYDAVAEMRYLDMVFKEAMRMLPSIGVLNRECTKPYAIPKLDIAIDPGVKVVIPIHAIQMDPQNFNSPEEYRPERFMTEDVNERNKYVYLPFGEGPRNCIGSRLGKMQSFAGLAAVLQKFTVEPSAKTPRNLKVDPRVNTVLIPTDGIPLKLSLRKSRRQI